MIAPTPGQAAYDAYDAATSARDGIRLPPWRFIKDAHQADWEAAAQAAITAYAAQHGPWAERAAEILTEGQP